MKKALLVFAAVVLCASMAMAQSQAKPVIYLGGGLSMPLGPTEFKDYWKMGFGFGGGVGVSVGPQIELIGKVSYNMHSFDSDKLLSDLEAEGEDVTGVTIDGGDIKILAFGADFKYIFTAGEEAKFKPFMIAGLGMANLKYTDVTVSDETLEITIPSGSTTEFALSGGAGFDYMFSPKAGFWFDARLATVLTEGETTTYLPFQVGLKFMLGN